jgi:hypothetical protein
VTTTPNPDPARAGIDQPPPARSAPPASARAGDHRLLTADELVALARLDSDEPLTDTDLAALNRLDEGHDGPDVDPREWELGDPETGAPPEWMALSGEERAWLDDRPEPAPVRPEILDAGFTHCGATGGIGFAGGGVLDKMPAGQELAACAERTWDAGLGTLADDELAGLIRAARRNASRQAALELAAIGELAAPRRDRDLRPPARVRWLPALSRPAAHREDPLPAVRVPGVPTAGGTMR